MIANSSKNSIAVLFNFLLIFFLISFLAYWVGNTVASKSPTISIALLGGFILFVAFLRYKSSIIFAFILLASMPSFLTEDLILLRGVNLVNFSWILMIFFVLFRPFSRDKIQFTVIDKNVLLMAIIIFISLLRGQFKFGMTVEEWLYAFAKPIQHILLYFIIFNHFSTKKDIKNILIVNVITSVSLAVILIWKHKIGLESGYNYLEARTGGLYENPNMVTMAFVFNFYVILILLEMTKKIATRIWLSMAFIPLLWGILFSYTRTAYIALIAGLLFYYFAGKNRMKLILAILIVGLALTNLPDTVIERTMTIGKLEKGTFVLGRSTFDRIEHKMAGIRYLLDNPLIIIAGGGAGDYENNAFRYASLLYKAGTMGRDPHDTIIGILCSVGLLGWIIIGALYYKIYKLSRKLKMSGDFFASKIGIVIQVQLLIYGVYSFAGADILMWDISTVSITFCSLMGCALILQRNLNMK